MNKRLFSIAGVFLLIVIIAIHNGCIDAEPASQQVLQATGARSSALGDESEAPPELTAEIEAVVDREAAARYGLATGDVNRALHRFYAEHDEFYAEDIAAIEVTGGNPSMSVALDEIAEIRFHLSQDTTN